MRRCVEWDTQELTSSTNDATYGRIVNLRNRQTYYLEVGQGRPVILLHGFFFDSSVWCRNIESLASYSKVYALDIWGFGLSTREQLDFSYDLFIDQVVEFMDLLEIPSATIVGHSFGGGVALGFASQYPERTEKLVLVAAAGLPNPEPLVARLFMLPGVGELLLRLPTNYLRKKMFDDLFVANANSIPSVVFDKLMRFHRIKGTISSLLSFMRAHFADKLVFNKNKILEMNIPILIIWGSRDRSIPLQVGQKLQSILSSAELYVIESAGHLPQLEQAEKFNDKLLDFLRRSSPILRDI